ncbi:hypothetical protein AHMF7605_12320 [Adhaeribacter arboris]|uniref:Uncharacterized protein n=1 Tax=Adhaeribacter arboris TaxID=2072846 RepID=A0A2T2YFI8_9BACT|nr:hypothetical protein [Adhaeribacter arboris]PSR54253.1 hypothetical protein AHMF7605_12320 [Adhaeribacter arboris]
MDLELEEKVIKRFIINKKQERYLTFIQAEKTRSKFIDELSHFTSQLKDFEEIKGNVWKVLEEKLKKLRNPTDCYVISENREIDARRLNIELALSEIIGHGSGTLLVFGNANMVYYEGEGPSDRWISKQIK